MNRVLFLVGAGVGYVLGARAGRERYEQIVSLAEQAVQSAPAQKAGAFAQEQLVALADGIADLTGQLQEQSKDFAPKLVHTAESLRDDLARRAADLGEQFQRNRELLDEAVESTRERIDGVAERNREKQLQEVLSVGDRRDETLDDLANEHDEMIDAANADERNRDE